MSRSSSNLIRRTLLKTKRPAKNKNLWLENRQLLGPQGLIVGKQTSSQQFFGSANSRADTISCRITQVPGTNNGQKATVVSMIRTHPGHRHHYLPVKFTPRQNPF